MRVVYRGPSRAVEVPALSQVFIRDEPQDVPDEVGASLIEQDVWEIHKTPRQLAAEAKVAEDQAVKAKAAEATTGTEQS